MALHEEEIYLAVPPNHRLAGTSHARLEEVAKDPFIGLQEGSGLREASDEFCRIAGFKPEIALEIADPSRLQTLVQAGIGVALIPKTLVREADGVKPCGIVKITEPICKRTIGLTWEKNAELSENVRLFKDYLLDYFAGTKAANE